MLTIEQERRTRKLLDLVDEVGYALGHAGEKLMEEFAFVAENKWPMDMEILDTEVLIRHAMDALYPLHQRLERKLKRQKVPVLARRRAKRTARKERIQVVPSENQPAKGEK